MGGVLVVADVCCISYWLLGGVSDIDGWVS